MHLFTWPYNPKLSACIFYLLFVFFVIFFAHLSFGLTKLRSSLKKCLKSKQNLKSQTYKGYKVSYFTLKSQIEINLNRWILFIFQWEKLISQWESIFFEIVVSMQYTNDDCHHNSHRVVILYIYKLYFMY